tara:strand:+ start:110 stop:637 length:528 start_codon:yes stop_codon:yes gene_type:complete
MALRKIRKSVIYGSVLVAHYGKDLSDKTQSSATYGQWGTDIDFTMMYPESHLELVTTGSARVDSNQPAGQVYGNAKYVINNQDEYQLRGLVGGNASRSGAHNHQNQQFGENNGRQNWRWYGYSTGVYMNHIHRPNTTNLQTIQTWVNVDSGSFTMTLSEGFTTVTEISAGGYNLT